MQAFNGATQRTRDTYSQEDRQTVELLLTAHFEAQRGSALSFGRDLSVTGAVIQRCERSSTAATTCEECKGRRKVTIRGATKDIDVRCPVCLGAGEFGTARKAREGICPRCNGSGEYCPSSMWAPDKAMLLEMSARLAEIGSDRRFEPERELSRIRRKRKTRPLVNLAQRFRLRGRHTQHWEPVTRDGKPAAKRVFSAWVENPDFDPLFKPARCTNCRGSGWDGGLDAHPIAPDDGGGAVHVIDRRTPVGDVLGDMLAGGLWRSVTVLELAFGEVGTYVTRRLCEPQTLAVWPVTKPGRMLMKKLAIPDDTRPHKLLATARADEDHVVRAMAATADTAASVMLERAVSDFRAHDAEGHIAELVLAVQSKGTLPSWI